MATESFEFARDMQRKNPVYLLRYAPKCTLSAAAYLKRGWEEKVGATREAIVTLGARLEAAFPEYGHYLLVGHGGWQPDNRITRHKKLWSLLAEQGVSLPKGARGEEMLLESGDGVKYFGAIDCYTLSDEFIASVLRSGWETQLLSIDKSAASSAVSSLLTSGWERMGHAPPSRVLDLICVTEAVAYLPLGWFDDRESGCAVIGRPELLTEAFPELAGG